jgi:hypothetical protein
MKISAMASFNLSRGSTSPERIRLRFKKPKGDELLALAAMVAVGFDDDRLSVNKKTIKRS